MKKIILWFLVLGFMAGIFYMSSQPEKQTNSSSYKLIDTIQYIVNPQYREMTQAEKQEIQIKYNHITRKITHATVYFLLCMLILLALEYIKKCKKIQIPMALLISLLYAVGDEWHQKFVYGRTSRLTDVIIDMSGATVAAILFYIFVSKRKRLKGERRD